MTLERFWDWPNAFAHPTTLWLVLAAAGLLVTASIAVPLLSATRAIGPSLSAELRMRTASWFALATVMGAIVLMAPGPFIIAVGCLSLACFNEFARATGLFRERRIYVVVALGIVLVGFAALDHWYGFFVALGPLIVVAIAAVSLPKDQPEGYIQRTALGIFGFVFFGVALGHFGYMANDTLYRPIVILMLFAVALSDITAYIGGKIIGGPKLVPATSPGKTVSGAITGFVMSAVFTWFVGQHVFAGTAMDTTLRLLGLAVLIGIAAPAGDLMMSAIKRDVGIKDAGGAIPGHGGFVDRFDSLLLVAPAAFHYIGTFIGFGLDQKVRLITQG